ncbi:conserved phage C-terminal domain-containing protein [bacterium]|nr:conserved phage C-terminal domain-containing protein [bacterium]
MQGWISIHRQIKDNWIWDDKPFSKGQAWIDILLRVNHKPKKVLIGNQLIDIIEGQTIWSIKDMASTWGWSRKKVDNFLNTLEKDEMLHNKRTTKYTVLTVAKWASYQGVKEPKEHQKNNNGTSKEHQKNTNNNVNNVNNEIIRDIVEFLNESAHTKYKPNSKKTKDVIAARLNDGFELEDFKKVIKIKCDEWVNTSMNQYLRPETLFSNKFEGYLNQQPAVKPTTELAGAICANTLGKRRPNALGG